MNLTWVKHEPKFWLKGFIIIKHLLSEKYTWQSDETLQRVQTIPLLASWKSSSTLDPFSLSNFSFPSHWTLTLLPLPWQPDTEAPTGTGLTSQRCEENISVTTFKELKHEFINYVSTSDQYKWWLFTAAKLELL